MRFAVLGPLEVRSSGGDLLQLPRRKARELLAVLILRSGRYMAADEIIDYLWGDRPPSSARANLQSYVADLRRLLVGDAAQLESADGRYRLRVGASQIDASMFEQLAAEGREALRNHDPALALAHLTRASALWRGQCVAEGLVLPPALEPDVARLTETRLAAFEDGIDARLELGQHRELEPDLLSLISEHPYRERLWGQLMLARYRSGRQAESLAAYQDVWHRLDDELGIRPGPQLDELQQRILRADPELDHPGANPEPRGSELPVPRQLPALSAVFVGRSAEMARILDLAAARETIVIDGMGGVGKTTLAVQAAHRFAHHYPDGQIYVDLGGFAPGGTPMEPGEALAEILGSLGRVGQQVPASLTGRAALWRSVAADRRILLVLDNASSEAQVEPLIPASADCCVVVTSRRRLAGLRHHHPVSLDVIGDSDAVAMLMEIVGAERMTRAAAVEIHALCEGLPLAIEVAGRRMRARAAWTSETLRARLARAHSRLTELTVGERSVTAAFRLSYGQLDDEQRQTFRLLSLHPGVDFGAGAAAALVGSDPGSTDRILGRLVDDHLLREDVAGRYRFHDLLKEFAAELVAESETASQRRDAVHRVVHWYLHASCEAAQRMGAGRQHTPVSPAPDHLPAFSGYESAMSWLESEWRNLVAVVSLAADHEMHEHVWRTAHALFGFFLVRGYNEQFVAMNRVALASARSLPDPRAEADMSHILGVALGRSAHYREALDVMRSSLELYQQLGDEQQASASLGNLGAVLWHCGRYAEAIAHVQRSLLIGRQLDDGWAVFAALNNLGELYRRSGRYETAREHLEEALPIAERELRPRQVATVLTGLGATATALGRYDAAQEYLQRAHGLAARIGHREGEGTALYELGVLNATLGDTSQAIAHYRDALSIGREIGDATLETQALNGLGGAFLGSGEHERALEHHWLALGADDRVGDPTERARAEAGIGRAMLTAGDTARARNHIARAVDLAQGIDLPEVDALRSLLVQLGS